jgi:S1-C subfamily serine protease
MRASESKKQEKKKETKEEQLCPDSEPDPMEVLDKISKSVCKINYTLNSKSVHGTGFFMEYKSNKYLITNYHVISEKTKNIEIEIWNKSTSEFNLNNRFIKYIKKPKDITIIQIRQNEFNDAIFNI